MESLRNHLRNANLAAERITAVEGHNVPAQFRDFFFTGDALHSKLKPGEVGCYASHLLAMQLVLERNLDYALVLEDDAVLPRDIADSLANVLTAVPAGWDIIHICKDSNRAVKTVATLKGSRRLVRYSRVPETTTGYLISRAGARKFLAPSKRYWPIDTDFRRPWGFGLQIYGVMPRLVDPSGFDSSIHEAGDHSRLRRGFPLPSRHCWTGNPLHTPEGMLFNIATLGPTSWLKCSTRNTVRRLVRVFHLKPLVRRLASVVAFVRGPKTVAAK